MLNSGKILIRMSKFTENHGHYFTFPLKLLWFNDPAKHEQTIQDCIDYSIYKFMESGKCGNGTDSSKFEKAHELLNFSGGTIDKYENTGRRISQTITTGDIYTSVKTSYLFDARENILKLELLLMVAAIKSIIGHKRNFAKAYTAVIIRRMYGHEMPLSRRQFTKLVSDGMAKRMFTLIPAGRGYYVSIRFTSNELKEIVMQRITKYEGKRIEAAQAGKDIRTLKKQLYAEYKQIPK